MLQPLLVALGTASLAAWLGVLLHPARPWQLRPVAEDEPEPPAPSTSPEVLILVPARNEAPHLQRTVPALLGQNYHGGLELRVVDDRSEDETAVIAERAGAKVVRGGPLPTGWAGKVWALEQGLDAAPSAAPYVLLTDADILHGPDSLGRLVAEAEHGDLALVSRMARLRTTSPAERLIVPPFLYFFNLLYPMPSANSGGRPAAAGGCILLRRDVLDRIGGFAAIRGAVIDDIALARCVSAAGGRVRIALSRTDVVSLREHDSLDSLWATVARTAFTELRYSWVRVAGALAALALMFPLPPLLAAALPLSVPGGALGVAAWATMRASFVPAIRFFGLSPAWALTLPLAGVLYGAMTLSSALRRRSSVIATAGG